jgi:hypothetical protein
MADSWDLNPDRLRVSPSEIQILERRIAQVPPGQRSNYQLRMMGIEIPPGYRLDARTGRLEYVAVDNGRPFYLDPKFAVPAIMSAGLATAAMGPTGLGLQAADGGLAASAGAPAALESSIFGSPAAMASAAGAGVGAAETGAAVSGAGGGLASRIPWGDIARTAIPIGGALAAGQLSQPSQGNGSEMPPELRELLAMQLNRIRASQPNYDLMLNMARGMTPKWARESVPQGGGRTPTLDLIQRMAEPR